ncbi:MAG: hypothetical protein FWG05_04370, partial [Kiritimatiellaeota bacterium]|nr:hypothetical protein [Kiritimatiellota bacterium]
EKDNYNLGAWKSNFKQAYSESSAAVQLYPDDPQVWRHITAVGSGSSIAYYLDGKWVGATLEQCDNAIKGIGFNQDGTSQKFADYLDEYRIANRVRSADWAWADYMCQASNEFFTTYADPTEPRPFVANLGASSVGALAATLDCGIIQNGETYADMPFTATAFWAFTNCGADEYAWTNAPGKGSAAALPALVPDTFAASASALIPDEDYFFAFKFVFDNGTVLWTAVDSFRTPGKAEFGTPYATALADSIRFGVPLDPGAGLVYVNCWIAENESDLDLPLALVTPAFTWTQPGVPAVLTHTVPGLAVGDERFARFEAYCVMPGSGAQSTIWSGVVSASAGLRELVWNGGANGIWNTVGANWLESGAPAVFINGNGAVFNTGAHTRIDLTENIEVSGIDLTIRNTQTTWQNPFNDTWAMTGAGKTLTLNGVFSITDAVSAPANAIDQTKITGSGEVVLNSGRFRFGNSANDFTGGATVIGGTLDGTLATANASPLGTGAFTLGSAEIAAVATVNLNATEHSTVSGNAVKITGGMNTGKLILNPGDFSIAAGFADLTQAPDSGATLQIGLPANTALDIAGTAAGMLPPWVVATSGDYLAKTPAGVAPTNDDADLVVFTGAALAANTNALAARVAGNLNLGAFTNTVNGISINNGVTISNGTLDFGAGDADGNAYVYAPSGASTISARIDGAATLRKFGPGRLQLTGGQDPDIINQEGWITLMPPADMTYNGLLTGSGAYLIRGGTITLPRAEYILNAMHINYGGLVIDNDTRVFHRSGFTLGAHDQGVTQNAGGVSTMTMRGGARWTQGPGQEFNFAVALGDHWTAHNQSLTISGVSSTTGEPTTLDMNNGVLQIGGHSNGNSNSNNNRLTVTEGAVITNAASIRMSRDQGGNGGTLTVSDGARVHTRQTLVSNANSHHNNIIVTGAETRWDNGGGVLFIAENNDAGYTGDSSVLVTDNARMHNVGEVRVGNRSRGDRGANISGNSLTVNDGAEFVMTGGNMTIGGGDSGLHTFNNTLVVAEEGRVSVYGAINVGHPSSGSHDNALVLRGGESAAATLTVQSANRMDLILGSSGLKPLELTGNANFVSGSSINAECIDKKMTGRIWPVVTSSGGTINTNDVSFINSQPELSFKLYLSANHKTLSVGIFPMSSLIIIR